MVKRVCIPHKCDVLSEQSMTVICCSFLPWVVDCNDFGSGHRKNKISKQSINIIGVVSVYFGMRAFWVLFSHSAQKQ